MNSHLIPEMLQDLKLEVCVYCGKRDKKLTVDHEVPLNHGGLDEPRNIVSACKSCNSSKGATPDLETWIWTNHGEKGLKRFLRWDARRFRWVIENGLRVSGLGFQAA